MLLEHGKTDTSGHNNLSVNALMAQLQSGESEYTEEGLLKTLLVRVNRAILAPLAGFAGKNVLNSKERKDQKRARLNLSKIVEEIDYVKYGSKLIVVPPGYTGNLPIYIQTLLKLTKGVEAAITTDMEQLAYALNGVVNSGDLDGLIEVSELSGRITATMSPIVEHMDKHFDGQDSILQDFKSTFRSESEIEGYMLNVESLMVRSQVNLNSVVKATSSVSKTADIFHTFVDSKDNIDNVRIKRAATDLYHVAVAVENYSILVSRNIELFKSSIIMANNIANDFN